MIIHNGELFAVDPRFEHQVAEAVQRSAESSQYSPGGDYDRPSLIVDLPLSGIAVVQVKGAIYRDRCWWGPTWDTLVQDLKFLDERPSIKGVVVLMDSPGGSSMGCQEACDAADAFSKPLVSFVTGYCCSAAYRFSCHCDKIYSTKSGQVGSIGTVLTVTDYSKALQEEGIEVVAAATGPYKTFASYGMPVTQEHRQFMAERVAVEQAGFVASLTARGLTAAQQSQVTDGRYWSAPEALSLGLIDGIKSVTEVTSGAVLLVQSVPGGSDGGEDKSEADQQASAVGPNEGSEITVSETTGQPAAKTGEVQGVSIAQIEQLCPGASPEFILQQAKVVGNSEVKVLQAFAALQQQQIADLKKQTDEASAAAASVAAEQQKVAQVAGTDAVGSTNLTQSVAGGNQGNAQTGGVIQQFEAIVDEGVKQGLQRQIALSTAVQENPDLHQQYIAAIKQMTPEQAAARRRRQVGMTSGDFSPAAKS